MLSRRIWIGLLLLISVSGCTQDERVERAIKRERTETLSGHRVALVIGNADYKGQFDAVATILSMMRVVWQQVLRR